MKCLLFVVACWQATNRDGGERHCDHSHVRLVGHRVDHPGSPGQPPVDMGIRARRTPRTGRVMSRRRHADLDRSWWWAGMIILGALWLGLVGIIIAAWLVTAVVALSVAGIAKLTHHDETAAHAIGS
jgi:hypothetical protein